jgi:hypothetical protein
VERLLRRCTAERSRSQHVLGGVPPGTTDYPTVSPSSRWSRCIRWAQARVVR